MAFSPTARNGGVIAVREMTNEELITKYSEVISTVARNPSARGAGPLLNIYRQEILRRMNQRTMSPQHT